MSKRLKKNKNKRLKKKKKILKKNEKKNKYYLGFNCNCKTTVTNKLVNSNSDILHYKIRIQNTKSKIRMQKIQNPNTKFEYKIRIFVFGYFTYILDLQCKYAFYFKT